ncbi:MAG: hypothetical protein OSB41_14640 [Kiritimatiellae bacterium]|nr:hypothetical protein [Kiritimatiellia bacterium]
MGILGIEWANPRWEHVILETLVTHGASNIRQINNIREHILVVREVLAILPPFWIKPFSYTSFESSLPQTGVAHNIRYQRLSHIFPKALVAAHGRRNGGRRSGGHGRSRARISNGNEVDEIGGSDGNGITKTSRGPRRPRSRGTEGGKTGRIVGGVTFRTDPNEYELGTGQDRPTKHTTEAGIETAGRRPTFAVSTDDHTGVNENDTASSTTGLTKHESAEFQLHRLHLLYVNVFPTTKAFSPQVSPRQTAN